MGMVNTYGSGQIEGFQIIQLMRSPILFHVLTSLKYLVSME